MLSIQRFALLPLVLWLTSGAAQAQAPPAQWAVRPPENTAAIKNPGKGWRGQIGKHFVWGKPPVDDLGSQPIGTPLETLRKWYVAWNEFETQESDSIDRLVELTEHVLSDFPEQGLQAIPRLAISSKRGSEAPRDLPGLDSFKVCDWYEKPKVRKRIERMIARAGRVWDNDPRIAFIEMGVVGKYGEHWDLKSYPKVQEYLHRAFQKAFKNKPVLIRYAGTNAFDSMRPLAEAGDYGFYQDSFTVPEYRERTRLMAQLDGGTRWQRAPFGGETTVRAHKASGWRYGFPDYPGKGRNYPVPSALIDPERFELLKDWVREFHASFVGSPHGVQLTDQPTEAIAEVHKLMGYRFLLDEVRGPEQIETGGDFELTIKIRNVGSGVLFSDHRLAVAFIQPPEAKAAGVAMAPLEPAALVMLDSAQPKSWLPGTDYDLDANVYRQPPRQVVLQESIRVPKQLQPGAYALCLAITDPEGKPRVRFATQHYWRGGYHPIAMVGVNQTPDRRLDKKTFFLDGIDPSLHGTIKPNARAEVAEAR